MVLHHLDRESSDLFDLRQEALLAVVMFWVSKL